MNKLVDWTACSTFRDSNGEQYIFLDTSFLQGQIMALGVTESENPFFTRYRILGANNGDSPRSWASVIRPGIPVPAEKYGTLTLTPQKMLLGFRYGYQCYFAYDLETKQFFGHDDVEALSPFVCLEQNTHVYESDVSAIHEYMSQALENNRDYIENHKERETPISISGVPHVEVLKNDLVSHPSPRAREIASDFLKILAEYGIK